MASISCPHCGFALPDTIVSDKDGKCTKCGKPIAAQNASTRSSKTKPYDERHKRIGALLTDAGLIAAWELKDALHYQEQQGGKIVDILISKGYLDRNAFVTFLARQPGITSLDLSNYTVPEEVIALVPRELAVKHEIIPIDRLGKLLTVAMVCPLDATAIKEIETATGLKVKPMLCQAREVRQALSKLYPSEEIHIPEVHIPQRLGDPLPFVRPRSAPSDRELSRIIQAIRGLPALSETVEKVRLAAEDITSSVEDIAELIQLDPPIAAKVLSVANSAAYGFPNRVDTIQLAVALLGLRETYSVVLSAAVMNMLDRYSRFDYKTYWMDAMCCAGAARGVAKACRDEKRSGVFAAGLLHDIGRVALVEAAPDLYVQVDYKLEDDALLAAEQATVGLTHVEAGGVLADAWGLPPDITETIRYHHQPEKAAQAKETVAMVAIAEILTRVWKPTEDDQKELFAACYPLFNILGVRRPTTERIQDLLSAIERNRFAWERTWRSLDRNRTSK